jgi:hypothetical protein
MHARTHARIACTHALVRGLRGLDRVFESSAWYRQQSQDECVDCHVCRSKHQELEAVLDQKEAEKQMIFSEMLQSKQRQEVLEQRLSKMVGVLMKACQSIGIGAIEHQDARVPQQITNEAGVDGCNASRSYKRPRLTVDKGDKQYLGATDYSQTDEWLEHLMQGMSRVSEAKAQGAFTGHGGYGTQMRITNADLSPRYSQPPTLTEIHDAPSGMELESAYVGDMSAEVPKELESVSRGLESIDGVQGLESISKVMSSDVPLSPGPMDDHHHRADMSVPLSPSGLDMKPEHGDELSKLDSQTLDLDALLASSGERGISVPLPSPTRPQAVHTHGNEPLPPMISEDSSPQDNDLPLQSPARILSHGSHGEMLPTSSLVSCGQVAQTARQARYH